MHDLVVRGGTVVDGSGRPRFAADVAVDGGVISEIGRVSEAGRQEIDAEGQVVTPGFVDGHTHFDAQLFWDPLAKPSCWNGVTTAVIGNCGFTLAPSREGARELVVQNLERAEDIPAEAMRLGVPWGFESFGEYMKVLDDLPKGLNYAAQIGHSALRTWAMGERAFDATATEQDLDMMRRELASAFDNGAMGFSTSRNLAHLTPDDRPVASRAADWNEFSELVTVAGSYPGAMCELAMESAARSSDREVKREFFARMVELAAKSRATFTFGVTSVVGKDAFEWQDMLSMLDEAESYGVPMVGQSHARGFTIYNSFLTQMPFDKLPVWKELRELPIAEQEAQLRDPDMRARLVQAATSAEFGEAVGAEARPPDYERLTVLLDPLPPNPTVAELARAQGMNPVDVVIDLALQSGMRQFFVQSVGDTSVETLGAIMRHPSTAMTFTDAGAHVGQIVDAGLQVYLLAHWVRGLGQFTLEEAVRMVTRVTARAWGFADRGLLRLGYAADLNVFDPETIGPVLPEVVADLPGGGIRLEQKSQGLHATVVNGAITILDGEPTGALAGRLLRRPN